jgi:hypothetical protein
MLQKGYECRQWEMEEWKQNWYEVFMDKVRRETEKKRGERERK